MADPARGVALSATRTHLRRAGMTPDDAHRAAGLIVADITPVLYRGAAARLHELCDRDGHGSDCLCAGRAIAVVLEQWADQMGAETASPMSPEPPENVCLTENGPETASPVQSEPHLAEYTLTPQDGDVALWHSCGDLVAWVGGHDLARVNRRAEQHDAGECDDEEENHDGH